MIAIIVQQGGQAGALSALIQKQYAGPIHILQLDESESSDLTMEVDLIFFSPGVMNQQVKEASEKLLSPIINRKPIIATGAGSLLVAMHMGMKLESSLEPLAGRTARMVHDQQNCFLGLSSPLEVARYDTQAIEETSLPPEFTVCGHSFDGEILAVRSIEHKLELLNFHPHSTATERGEDMIANCLRLPGEVAQ